MSSDGKARRYRMAFLSDSLTSQPSGAVWVSVIL